MSTRPSLWWVLGTFEPPLCALIANFNICHVIQCVVLCTYYLVMCKHQSPDICVPASLHMLTLRNRCQHMIPLLHLPPLQTESHAISCVLSSESYHHGPTPHMLCCKGSCETVEEGMGWFELDLNVCMRLQNLTLGDVRYVLQSLCTLTINCVHFWVHSLNRSCGNIDFLMLPSDFVPENGLCPHIIPIVSQKHLIILWIVNYDNVKA